MVVKTRDRMREGRLAPAIAQWLEYELRELPHTRQALEDADAGRLDRFGPSYRAEFERLRRMRAVVAAIDAVQTTDLRPAAAAVLQGLMDGERIDAIAAAAGWSPNTIRRTRAALLMTIAERLGMA